MPPTLRKRKAPAEDPVPAPPAKKKGPVAKAAAKVKEAVVPKPKPVKAVAKTNGATASPSIEVGSTITLEGFGGEIELNDGTKTTLKKLVDESKSGVVLFTYPKASTPGCKHTFCGAYLKTALLTVDRHKTSMLLPRRVHASYSDRFLYLWSIQRLPKSEHYIQRKATTSISTAL